MYKHIGLLALSVAVLMLARNLGDYKNTPLAVAAAFLGGMFTVLFVVLVILDLIERRKKAGARELEVLPAPIHTITFDYLPTSPLQSGQWTRGYGQEEPLFERDGGIAGGIRMHQVTPIYAMDYRLPQYATLANHIDFTAKFISDAIVYAEVEVVSEDGSHSDVFWFAHVIGHKAPLFLPQYREWKFHISPRRDRFLLDLREEVRASVGPKGLVLSEVRRIRIRGNISISPIKLRRLE
jgi:hypothetical protein